MALKFSQGKATPQSTIFDARTLGVGLKTSYRGIQEAIGGAKSLQRVAAGSDNPALVQYANEALEKLRQASSLVSDVDFGLSKFTR